MASLVLSGDTSGSVTLAAPAVAGSTTQTLPAASGTIVVGSAAVSAVGQIPFSTDGTTYTPTDKIVSGTAATVSGTSVDFTGIPSWVKRITVMFIGVSTSGTSNILVQLGDSGGVETTGYVSQANTFNSAPGGTASTAGKWNKRSKAIPKSAIEGTGISTEDIEVPPIFGAKPADKTKPAPAAPAPYSDAEKERRYQEYKASQKGQ